MRKHNYIIIIFLLLLAVFGVSYLFQHNNIGGGMDLIQTDQQKIDALPAELKLKATPDKILDSGVVESISINKDTGDKIDNGQVQRYAYVSDIEVPQDSIVVNKKIILEDMNKRNENTKFFQIEQTATTTIYQAKFYGGSPFIKENDRWMQVETATTTIDSFQLQTKPDLINRIKEFVLGNVLANNYTPGAGDGWVRNYVSGSWSTCHDATSGDAYSYIEEATSACSGYRTSTSKYLIYRLFFPTDTSAIGAGSTITAASFNGYVNAVYKGVIDSYSYVSVVQTSQASVSALATSDYSLTGTTEGIDTGERKWVSTTTINSYYAWNLNSTGIGWINKTGYTKIGFREGHDITNNSIGTTNDDTGFNILPSEDATYKPYLLVTFTTGGGGNTTSTSTIFKIQNSQVKILNGQVKIIGR